MQKIFKACDVLYVLKIELFGVVHNCVYFSQWAALNEGRDQLDKWILEVETWLKTDTELKNTLAEKRSQLQNNKVKFDLITQVHSQLLTRTTPKTNFTVGLAFFVDL